MRWITGQKEFSKKVVQMVEFYFVLSVSNQKRKSTKIKRDLFRTDFQILFY